ncbi:hypothetical protein OHS33_24695 [Streptomyces sp. NBC_00536]|uniref:hypothetical protein n=1 Tax=Streptomyces sp. NBC_00536 TaxID=2975769 RepID=UPI002E7FD05D|nr:hypothetical protein [Streptomyces sp. NBC_00536]WUC81250.1 hypothetical protein OHS33_24695 [Streptomyces sp. NBC_00536]
MRTYRTTATAAVAAACALTLALGGCAPGGPAGPEPGSAGATRTGTAPTAPPATTTPSASASATASATTAPTAPAPARQQLLLVTRSGGYAGRQSTLDIRDDGSWTLLDGSARPVGTGKLTAAYLDELRGALRQADFAHLPPVATDQGKVFDGFTYAFVHDGHEVVATDGSVPPTLMKVLDALPSFDKS